MSIRYSVAGKTVEHDDSTTYADKLSRVAFAIMGDTVVVQEEGDMRPMVAVLDMLDDKEEFEQTVRGVFDGSNIIFFIGEYYMQVPDIAYYDGPIQSLRQYINKRFGYTHRDIAVWNGVEVGEVGTTWKPVNLVAKLLPNNEVVWFS